MAMTYNVGLYVLTSCVQHHGENHEGDGEKEPLRPAKDIGQFGHDGVGGQRRNGVHNVGRREGRVLREIAGRVSIVHLGRVLDEGADERSGKETEGQMEQLAAQRLYR